jgi:hypothetical protein
MDKRRIIHRGEATNTNLVRMKTVIQKNGYHSPFPKMLLENHIK